MSRVFPLEFHVHAEMPLDIHLFHCTVQLRIEGFSQGPNIGSMMVLLFEKLFFATELSPATTTVTEMAMSPSLQNTLKFP